MPTNVPLTTNKCPIDQIQSLDFLDILLRWYLFNIEIFVYQVLKYFLPGKKICSKWQIAAELYHLKLSFEWISNIFCAGVVWTLVLAPSCVAICTIMCIMCTIFCDHVWPIKEWLIWDVSWSMQRKSTCINQFSLNTIKYHQRVCDHPIIMHKWSVSEEITLGWTNIIRKY